MQLTMNLYDFFNVEHDSFIFVNEISRVFVKLLDDNESNRYLENINFSSHYNNSIIEFNNPKLSIQI